MGIFERASHVRECRRHPAMRGGFTLTELLVVTTIILLLTSLSVAAISAATSSQKKLRTAALIGKLDSIIATHYAEYASRTVEVPEGETRSAVLRDIAAADLPDNWKLVSDLANKSDSELSQQQLAYRAVWNAIEDKTTVDDFNSAAECLFMIVMQGGVADCLDCRISRIDVGDNDGDQMPEFVDAWGSPIAFVFQPRDLRLPAGSTAPFFSSAEPFSAEVPSLSQAKGGLIRPLIFSAGPDRIYGLDADTTASAAASTSLGYTAGVRPEEGGDHTDNITNFDEEAKR